MKGCFVCIDGGKLPTVFKDGRLEAVKNELEMPPEIITEKNIKKYRNFLRQTQVMFCSWDMIAFTAEQVAEYFPALEVIFYAAASVRYFARPFMERGVRVLTCHRIMAIPVAEFTVSHIAGSARVEVLTHPDFMIAQLARYKKGLPFEDWEVTLDLLATMV